MINPESLRKYSRIISSCSEYGDMDFVIEQMFKLYVPTKGEIDDFLDNSLQFYGPMVRELCRGDTCKQGELYSEVKTAITQAIVKLFEDRFERLSSAD